ERRAARRGLEHRPVPELRAAAIPAAAEGVWRGCAAFARRASPAGADRSGAVGEKPGAVSFVLAGRPDSGGAAARFPADPAAHHDADRGGRGFQFALRLPATDYA